MMTSKSLRAVTASLCAAAVAGCASSSAGSGASSQGFAPLPSLAEPAAPASNVAGQYLGKFRIKNAVIGTVSFNLTQSGTAVGGTLKLVLSKSTLSEPVAMTLNAANNTLTGTAVDAASKTPCTYALKGSYNPKTFVLRGTSSPLTCTGKVATFTTTEQCFYNTGSGNAIRQDANGIIEC